MLLVSLKEYLGDGKSRKEKWLSFNQVNEALKRLPIENTIHWDDIIDHLLLFATCPRVPVAESTDTCSNNN